MLLATRGYGITAHDIDMSCPSDLKPYLLAYEQEQVTKDRQIWNWIGNYGISALIVAIDHCFNGEKAKTEYIKSSITDMKKIDTQQSIQQQREAFVMKMRTIKTNWDLTHPKKDSEK